MLLLVVVKLPAALPKKKCLWWRLLAVKPVAAATTIPSCNCSWKWLQQLQLVRQ
jgi:hypothetical protein